LRTLLERAATMQWALMICVYSAPYIHTSTDSSCRKRVFTLKRAKPGENRAF
jgi:hypothetical protein